MTFGQTSFGRSFARTRLLLRKQLWIWPVLAVVLLATIGYIVNKSIRRTMEAMLHSELVTLVEIERSMVDKWCRVQAASAVAMANDSQVRRAVLDLLAATAAAEDAEQDAAETAVPHDSATLVRLRSAVARELEPGLSSQSFVGYVITDKRQRVIAALTPGLIGQSIPQYESFIDRTLQGLPTVSAPFPSLEMLKDASGRLRSHTPTMFACAPIRDENLQVVAVLALRIRPDKEYTEILQLGRIGRTGETYAVNQEGTMVSNSRFDESLILLGLLPDNDESASILNLQVRDPGGDLTAGYRPHVRRRELPLTRFCAAAIGGTTGVDTQGARGYRGTQVIGAWTWLPEYRLGIITEIEAAEAYRPLTILQWSFYTLYGLLGLSAAAIFAFTLVVARLRRKAQQAAVEARQLGQYRLEEKIGAGAMGVVYRGQHAMLRRPTAIKMLDLDRGNEASIQRFEREVQTTCNLNNPHTIAIYDYGRTPEGVFYYAMEYLDGIDLQTLVDQYGPQPEGRVVDILRQVCQSLYEAHASGLVHRDIKPANIMLNRRGGVPDFVKVLDFGLVKAVDDGRGSSREVSGTPLYMSPEAIQMPDSVDARSDIYAVGAVGYFLLTGHTVFDASSLNELSQQHLRARPLTPTQRLGRSVSETLEHALLSCLEKSRSRRPQTARDLAAALARVSASWTSEDAESWWSRYERDRSAQEPGSGQAAPGAATKATGETVLHRTAEPDVPAAGNGASAEFERTTLFEPPTE